MESKEGEESSIPFQLQFDKPIPFQVFLLFFSKFVAFSDFKHGGVCLLFLWGKLREIGSCFCRLR